MKYGLVLLLGVSIALAGCASSGSKKVVKIKSDPTGARCDLEGATGYGIWVTTPADINLHVDLTPIKITCTKSGYEPFVGELQIQSRSSGLAPIAILVQTGVPGLLLYSLANSDYKIESLEDEYLIHLKKKL